MTQLAVNRGAFPDDPSAESFYSAFGKINSNASEAQTAIDNLTTLTTDVSDLTDRVDDSEGAWTTYTPTITPASGAFTSASATGKYIKMGKTVHGWAKLTINTIGTAPNSYVDLSMPLPSVGTDVLPFMGREINVTQKIFSVIIHFGDNKFRIQGEISNVFTYPAADGHVLYFNYTYETT